MSKYYTSIEQLIGSTPLLRLCRLEQNLSLSAGLFAKLESFNPAGSAKDRVAKAMIEDAEARGLLTDESVIIEPTSGNTGIGLVSVGVTKGYRVIIVMPDSMSPERRLLMKAYGGELVLTPGHLGMAGAIQKAKELAETIPHSFIPGQFDNPANPQAHYLTTGPELYRALDGNVDAFVCGVGTGGTVTGVARYLKERLPACRIIGIEPAGSPVLSGGKAGAHGLQGIGAGFVPSILQRELIDEVITVTQVDAYRTGRLVGKHQGLLLGISAGAAAHAAIQVASRPEFAGKNVVVLFPDGGERYLSTPMYMFDA